MLFRIFILPIVFIAIQIQFVLAQEKKFEVETAIIDKISFNALNWRNMFLPIAGYEPLTRFEFGVGLLSTKRLSKDTSLPVSFSEFDMIYTQNQQFIIEEEIFFYLGKNYLVKGYAGYAKFPDRFWGLGTHTSDAALERYNNNRIYANIHFLKRIRQNLYIGLKYRLFDMYNILPNPGDPSTLQGAIGEKGGVSSGIGYSAIWDTRDYLLNSQRGLYINVAHSFFGKYAGSQFNFSRFEVDIRKFIRLNSLNHILALQTNAIFSTGNPPFVMMALLGSDSDMRGYYKGRYRDLDFMSAQAEYRLPLFWRIGMVAFAGAGDVAHSIDKFNIADFKYTLGGGLRLKVNKKDNVNIRIDYALGYRSDGFYISLGEAF